MEENNTDLNQEQVVQEQPVQFHEESKNRLFLISGLVAVLTLLFVTLGYKYFQSSQNVLGNADKNVVKMSDSGKKPKASPTPTVKKVQVKSGSDLSKLLKEVDSSSTASMDKDFQQNVKESGSL